MKPLYRKFVLTAHIAFSVGWLGAVAAFLVLAVQSLKIQDAQLMRGFYLALWVTGWYSIVPMCLASLGTGLIQSLGTQWGLFKYYWVSTKFILTVISTLILFAFTRTLGDIGVLAANTGLSLDELRNLSQSPVLHSSGGLLILLVNTILSIYKPWGKTRYGRRQQREQSGESQSDYRTTGTPWYFYILIGLGVLVLAFVVLHFAKGGMGQRGH